MGKFPRRLRRGENHPKATCTDHEVELIRRLHEGQDSEPGMGYKKLAKKMDMPVRTIRDICNYVTR